MDYLIQGCKIEDCVQIIENINRSAFSLTQSTTQITYNSCTDKVITSVTYHDLNHWFGVIVMLSVCALLAYYASKIKD